MGTISNALSGYYSLANLLSSGSGSSTSSSTVTSLQALENSLFSSGSGSASGASNAYLLDLSPAAQSLLSGSSASGSANGSSTRFTLTSTQQTEIENILAKYKDAPLDQATFDSIQNDLQAAGLSPQTLGAEDQIKSFNPTNVLLSALSGDYSNLQTPANSASGEQTKETNYLKNIVSLWKSQDTSTSSASGTASTSATSSASATKALRSN